MSADEGRRLRRRVDIARSRLALAQSDRHLLGRDRDTVIGSIRLDLERREAELAEHDARFGNFPDPTDNPTPPDVRPRRDVDDDYPEGF